MRSLELASDLDDSDGRFGGVRIAPLGLLVVAVVDGRGDSGSFRVASGRRLSSVKDFRSVFWRSKLSFEWLPSRGMSVERRNLAAKLILDVFFFGPLLSSFVGAVVMISGAGSTLVSCYVLDHERGTQDDLRRGTGGVFSDCCLARRDNCESLAFRKRKTENRWCLLFSSCMGGVSGRFSVWPTGRLPGRLSLWLSRESSKRLLVVESRGKSWDGGGWKDSPAPCSSF